MKLQWKVIPTGDGILGQWAGLYVTLTPKGQIRMSRITFERLGSPEGVNVLFDERNNIIGVKPCTRSAKNAFRPCVIGAHGAKRIHAYRLIKECDIRLPQTIQFVDPEIDHDGILQLDLRTAKVSQRSIAHYRRRRERAPDGKYPAGGESPTTKIESQT